MCDPPGFSDTNGLEVDISNSIGILKTMKSSKTVRPVILISGKDYESKRMTGFKDTINVFVDMLKDPKEYLSSFSFLLTSFSDPQKEDFDQNIKNLIEQTFEEEKNEDSFYLLFLEEFESKLKIHSPKFIDPIKGNRKDLLSYLIGITAIAHPNEAFKFFMEQRSRDAMKEQLRTHQLVIASAIKEKDYLFVKFKLDEIKYLKDLVDKPYIVQIYQVSCQIIVKETAEQYEKAKLSFNNWINRIDTQNIINGVDTQDIINDYILFIDDAKKYIDVIKSEFKIEKLPSSNDLLENLNNQVKNLEEGIKKYELNDVYLKYSIEKMKIISSNFKNIKLIAIEIELEKKLDMLKSNYMSAIQNFNFVASSKCISIAKEANEILVEYFSPENFKKFEKEAISSLKILLNRVTDNLNHLVNTKESPDVEFVDNLNKEISIFDSAKHCFYGFSEFANEIHNSFNSFQESIKTNLKKTEDEIISHFEKGKSFANIEAKFKHIYLLQNVSKLKIVTCQSYHSTFQKINGFISEFKQNLAKQMGESFDLKTNYDKIYQIIGYLEDFKWFDFYNPGVYSKIEAYIKENFTEQVLKLKTSLKELNLEVDNYENIIKAEEISKTIFRLEPFVKYIRDLDDHIREAKDYFLASTEKVFTQIKNKFWEQNSKIEDFLSIRNIKMADDSIQYLKFCGKIEFLQQTNCNSILDQFTKKINDYYFFLKLKLEEVVTNISSYTDLQDEQDARKVQLFGNCSSLAIYARELNEINNHPGLSEQFNIHENLFENLKIKMIEYIENLNEEFGMMTDTYQISTAYGKLEILKALRQIDEIFVFPNETFTTLYRDFRETFRTSVPDILKNVSNHLKTKDFTSVYDILTGLSNSLDPGLRHQLTQAKRKINTQLKIWTEEAKTYSRLFIGSINEDDNKILTKLVPCLKTLKQIKILDDYIDEKNLIQDCMVIVDRNLNDAFSDSFLTTENALKSFNFTSAKNSIRSLKIKYEILDIFCTPEIIQNYKKVKLLHDSQVEELLRLCREKNISDYLRRPPKEDFEKLKSIHNENAIETLSDSIISKFRDSFQSLKDIKTRREKDLSLTRLEMIISQTIPDNLANFLQTEIGEIKEELKKQDEDTKISLQRAFQEKNLEYLENNILDLKQAGINSPNVVLVTTFLNQHIDQLEDQIKKCLDSINFEKVFSYLKTLNDYLNFLQKYLESNQKLKLAELSEKLMKKIEQFFHELLGFFTNERKISTCSNSIDFKTNFKVLISTLKFKISTMKELSDELLPQLNELDMKSLKIKINQCLYQYQESFKNSIKTLNVPELKIVLDKMKKLSPYILDINEFNRTVDGLNDSSTNKAPLQTLGDEILEITYDMMLEKVKDSIINLKNEINSFEFPNENTLKYENERNIFYANLNSKVEVTKNFGMLDEHSINYPNILNFYNEISNILINKCNVLVENLSNLFISKNFSIDKCKQLNQNYSNLSCFMKHVKIPGLKEDTTLREVEKLFFTYVDNIQYNIENNESIEEVSVHLIKMKTLSENLPIFKKEIDDKIDNALKHYKNKRGKNGGVAISKLGTFLSIDPIGKLVIEEHKIFEGYQIAMFNGKVQKHDIEYVLANTSDPIEGASINSNKLLKRYLEFDNAYKTLLEENLKPDVNLSKFVEQIKSKFRNKKIEKWDSNLIQTIPNLTAWIFVLWTLSRSKHYYDNEGSTNQDFYLLKPHPAQVIAIFRLFGVGDDKEILSNSLCEIGTGEGKSVVLAVTSCIFAIYGFNVSCACYSEYLSQRDYNEFLHMFELLGINDSIEYGTFNKVCENMINSNENIRNAVKDLVIGKELGSIKIKSVKKRILLIDEVDVFLNEDFYGNIYRPIVTLKEKVKQLTDFIWINRNNELTIEKVKKSNEFAACCEKYKEWEFLIKEAVKNMIIDVNAFEKPAYLVKNDKIGYVQLDGVSFSVFYGYKTLFAYYHENEKGRISTGSLEENVFIQIKCGDFSYAEIPHQFDYIMGVTGTLRSLSNPEKEIINNVYKIKKETFIPSVFGTKILTFIEKADVFIENINDYHNRIYREIDCRLKGKLPGTERAVLVFFKSRKDLMNFYNSKAFSRFKEYTKVLTEEDNLTISEKDKFVKDATRSGAINLITKSFGRGTDFVCRDDIVQNNGGVHVLQTFLSDQLSEEIQIKGRTARQGDSGSYSLVILDTSLEKFSITLNDIKVHQADIYDFIDSKRNAFFENQYGSNKEFVEFAKEKHAESLIFIQDLSNRKINSIKQFLFKENLGDEKKGIFSRTIVLMDATSSMYGLLTQAKNTVGKMFERAKEVLKDHKVAENCFELQFTCYRDYDCGLNKILQASSWEKKPDNLRAFMEKIDAEGGEDMEEAIEIAFWHVNQENLKSKVSQVILIADAPAKDRQTIIKYRKNYFGEKTWEEKFGKPTYYLDELQNIVKNGTRVFAFYLKDIAKKNFEEIAKISGTIDNCKLLDINSSKGSETLTNVVTSQVLANIGNSIGKGNELAEAYMKKFIQGHK